MDKNFNYDLSYTQNRELSWLEFNIRVLNEAHDPEVPSLEKLKFISIFTSNLDEFFMVRVGSLFDLSKLKKERLDDKTGMTYTEQLSEIFKKMPELYRRKDQAYSDVESQLRFQGISNLKYEELTKEEKKIVDLYFDKSILPILSPLVLDSHHPFPHLSNNTLIIVANMKDDTNQAFTGLIQMPVILEELFYLPGTGVRYILTAEIIRARLSDIFNFKIIDNAIISVTRNADLNLEEDFDDNDEDFRLYMKKALKKRSRLEPVRLEINGKLQKNTVEYLKSRLNLKSEQIYYSESPLKMDYVFSLFGKLPLPLEKTTTYKPYTPVYPVDLNPSKSIINQVVEKDRLLFFPFESIDPFLSLLKEASNDPYVISIKITIYRLASISKVAEYLAHAAENGKEVVVIMELRARFDEDNNINWSERLEQAGCTVIYGFEDYKIHSKICLITRHKDGVISYISQFGTGNYNEKTAKQYTDLSLITSDYNLGMDAQTFFRNMMVSNLDGQYNHLLVAPYSLKPNLVHLIDEQIALAKSGENALIKIKCNSVTERDIIDKLSEASNAGVKIYMNVRGICCILPGIPGKTENIHITSIVGRYLEHPRIYIFGEGENPKVYISSADLMTRNLTRRVEIACPIYDPIIKSKVIDIVDLLLTDDKKSSVLKPDGSYVKVSDEPSISSQDYFMDLAVKSSKKKQDTQKVQKTKRTVTSEKIIVNKEEIVTDAISKMSLFEKFKLLFLKK
ncbi:polyphosphate kinase 1 [Microaceticoccus formicicus]|uniref:polyphosphate kinase 1 n=1 Tax=Microaceticoccus formicicus TaxID=3118105 RepID=UPI003CD00120|nr:polyphosphate kinase 1 [Peptoniphilaceae bacterium AMB_02]